MGFQCASVTRLVSNDQRRTGAAIPVNFEELLPLRLPLPPVFRKDGSHSGVRRALPCAWLIPHSVHENANLSRPRRMSQLPQRFGLDLPYTFPGDRERLADFLERVLAAVLQAKTHLDDLLLARGQRAQHLRSLVFQVDV